MRTRQRARDFGQDISNTLPTRPLAKKIPLQATQFFESQPLEIEKLEARKSSRTERRGLFWNAVDDYEHQILRFTFDYNSLKFDQCLSEHGQLRNLPVSSVSMDKGQLSDSPVEFYGTSSGAKNSNVLMENKKCGQLLPLCHQIFPFYSPDLSKQNRKLVVGWLLQVHKKMRFRYQTLYLTIYLMDKYCQQAHVSKKNYQLLASACLFIAGKYEEIATPKISRIVSLCDGLFTIKDLLKMQSMVFVEMNFSISRPSINWFLDTFLNILSKQEKQLEKDDKKASLTLQFNKNCNCLMEMSLFHTEITLKFSPQTISAAIILNTSLLDQFLNVRIEPIMSLFNSAELACIQKCKQMIKPILFQTGYEVIKEKYPTSMYFKTKIMNSSKE